MKIVIAGVLLIAAFTAESVDHARTEAKSAAALSAAELAETDASNLESQQKVEAPRPT
ncbi:MAG: hypothetical protein H7124_09170 [Phycisphaerales bacterium]|nr:hypothetical protein [Hyphomonadaceae bacterium]